MSLQQDFDRIALVTPDGAARNDHYHNFLLRHLPLNCQNVLEVGCGMGAFARQLAQRSQHVLAIDLSPEMIRIAREQSTQFPNIDFQLADICDLPLADDNFDCIASIATLHHVPLKETLLKLKAALKPGGTLLILDLFEPAHLSDSLFAGLSDAFLNLLALPISATLRLIRQRRLFPSREVRAAWRAHEVHDLYPSMRQVHFLCAEILPSAKIKKHLLWRYSIVWKET